MANSPFLQKKIDIYINDRRLYLMEGKNTAKSYPIAVGKPSTPTPTGTYQIINKIINPGGMLGTRWLGLSIPNGNYGIHGTFQPDSIGKAISNGCIRLFNSDVEELFTLVRIGTLVTIRSSLSNTEDHSGFSYLYIIKPGDTLWDISKKFSVSVDELVHLNNIVNPNNLQVGQELKIP